MIPCGEHPTHPEGLGPLRRAVRHPLLCAAEGFPSASAPDIVSPANELGATLWD